MAADYAWRGEAPSGLGEGLFLSVSYLFQNFIHKPCIDVTTPNSFRVLLP